MMLEKPYSTFKRINLELYHMPYTKVSSKWINDQNVSIETIKPIEENIGDNFLEKGVGNDFLNLTAKAKETKAKNK